MASKLLRKSLRSKGTADPPPSSPPAHARDADDEFHDAPEVRKLQRVVDVLVLPKRVVQVWVPGSGGSDNQICGEARLHSTNCGAIPVACLNGLPQGLAGSQFIL